MSEPKKPDLPDQETGVTVKPRARTKRPSMYKVLLLNDDYTPMEFVIEVLVRIFHKGQEDATRIMLHVHQHGVAITPILRHLIHHWLSWILIHH